MKIPSCDGTFVDHVRVCVYTNREPLHLCFPPSLLRAKTWREGMLLCSLQSTRNTQFEEYYLPLGCITYFLAVAFNVVTECTNSLGIVFCLKVERNELERERSSAAPVCHFSHTSAEPFRVPLLIQFLAYRVERKTPQ